MSALTFICPHCRKPQTILAEGIRWDKLMTCPTCNGDLGTLADVVDLAGDPPAGG